MDWFIKAIILSLLGLCQGKYLDYVDPSLQEFFRLKYGGRVDVVIDFEGGNSEAIERIQSKYFPSRAEKIDTLVADLRAVAEKSQALIQKCLKRKNYKSESSWIANKLTVYEASAKLIKFLARFPQVSNIQKLPIFPLPSFESKLDYGSRSAEVPEWGVKKIGANLVWANDFKNRGEGVVVANIDSGVRVTHEDLQANFRLIRGWLDPYTNTAMPDDADGHGTHTMGTICGKNGIGVAPDATWIACRGCNEEGCAGDMLLKCFEFMVQPTHANGTGGDDEDVSSYAADVVSNSWGGLSNGTVDNYFNDSITAWREAGILYAFAIGNDGDLGDGCNTTANPGDMYLAFGVGATDINDTLAWFSSKGPGPASPDQIKPDISAPGLDVRSAWMVADNSYNTISGTSMATPHTAGAIALALKAHRDNEATGQPTQLTQDRVEYVLEQTAVRVGLTLPANAKVCDEEFSNGRYPNNEFGYGRLDAYAAVTQIDNQNLKML